MAQVTTHLMREIGTDQMVLINPLQIRFIRGCNDPQHCEIVFSEAHSVIVWASIAEVTRKFANSIGVRSDSDPLDTSGRSSQTEIKA